MATLIPPCKEMTLKMHFFECRVVEEFSELSHKKVVQMGIVLISDPVDHIEVTIHQPWP
jgi:hypothetical protein